MSSNQTELAGITVIDKQQSAKMKKEAAKEKIDTWQELFPPLNCSTISCHKNKGRAIIRTFVLILSLVIMLSALVSGCLLVFAYGQVTCDAPSGSELKTILVFGKSINASHVQHDFFPSHNCADGGSATLVVGLIASPLLFIIAKLYSLRGKNQGHVCACLAGCYMGRLMSEMVDVFVSSWGPPFLLAFVASTSWIPAGDFYVLKMNAAQTAFSWVLFLMVIYLPSFFLLKKFFSYCCSCCCCCCKTDSQKYFVGSFVLILLLVTGFGGYVAITSYISSVNTETTVIDYNYDDSSPPSSSPSSPPSGDDDATVSAGQVLKGGFSTFSLFNDKWGPLPSKTILALAGTALFAVGLLQTILGLPILGKRIRGCLRIKEDWDDEVDDTFTDGANAKRRSSLEEASSTSAPPAVNRAISGKI